MNLWSHRFSQNTIKRSKDICPHYTGQKSWQYFVYILGEMMTSKIHSENNWPFVHTKYNVVIFAPDFSKLLKTFHKYQKEKVVIYNLSTSN